ncbi:hypothetical protein L210DRAFT_870999 [Boletus edulis BED1]|uniref:Citrate transporter-like domain-containing protein n=1 Tax=Boletus edulis BED1 TaxID=1328754 RepID=A0AAD4BJC8_BOLED|nr:hypothetical protein L210DRAFT_870999 [Boletus edulis BED1]
MTSGYAIATLVVFIISIIFVIRPVTIPTPRHLPRIPINLTTAPILAIALLWAAQCLDPAVIRNGIVGTEGIKPYNILILFFSLAYMAITLDITGVLEAAAFWVSNKGGRNGWKLYLCFYIMLTLLSILLSNDPVVLSGTVFLVYYAKAAELDSWTWIMAEFAAANTATLMLFVRNPTNVVMREGFGVDNAAFIPYIILPFLACNVFCFITLAFQYRNQAPKRSTCIIDRDPRSALLDPFGAWVGSVMFGATLILCPVAMFLGVDVWMISLPFAVSKILFDLAWDHYRYTHHIPMLGRGSPGADEGADRRATVDEDQRAEDTACYCPSPDEEQPRFSLLHEEAVFPSCPEPPKLETRPQPSTPEANIKTPHVSRRLRSQMDYLYDQLDARFPTFTTALPQLPFPLIPLVLSQCILIEALSHQGLVELFADWLIRASGNRIHPTIWLISVLGFMPCNLSGTNIGVTILLTKVVRAAALPYDANRAAAIALAVTSNVAAVTFAFSAWPGGLLCRVILRLKGQRNSALWSLLPILVMASVGFGIVSAGVAFDRDGTT